MRTGTSGKQGDPMVCVRCHLIGNVITKEDVGELGEAVRKCRLMYAPSYHRERHNGCLRMEAYAPTTRPRPNNARELETKDRRVPSVSLLGSDRPLMCGARWRTVFASHRRENGRDRMRGQYEFRLMQTSKSTHSNRITHDSI